MADHHRPQAHRDPLLLHRPGVLRRRRGRGAAHAHAAHRPQPASARPAGLRRAFHDARGDDDLPLRHPDLHGGVRQLPAPAHDRRARHGVPAHERPLVLDLRRVRPVHVHGAGHRARPRRGVVQLRAARLQAVRAGAEHRLLLPGAHLQRHLHDGGRRELHRDALQAPRPGDVAEPDAAVLLRLPGGVLRARVRAPAADRGRRLPRARPADRHALLRRDGRRGPRHVAAPVLDLRPPRGLHHHPARVRDRDVDHPDVRAPADGGLPARRARRDPRRVHRLRRLGAPHVRRRDGDGDRDLLRRGQHHHRDPQRDPAVRAG